MDVLRPQIVTFDGRNYRKNPIQEKQYQHEEDEDFYPGNPGGSLRSHKRENVLCTVRVILCFVAAQWV
jgi:hypothetical protein